MTEEILLNIPVSVYDLVNGSSWNQIGNSDYNLIIAKDKNTNASRMVVQDPSNNISIVNNFINKESDVREAGDCFQFVVVGDQAHGYRFGDVASCNKFKEIFNYCKNPDKEIKTQNAVILRHELNVLQEHLKRYIDIQLDEMKKRILSQLQK